MKKIICLCLMSILLLGGGATLAQAVSGIEVIASEVVMIKGGRCGERVEFCEGDFKSALAVDRFDGVRIEGIPSEDVGFLLLGGRGVSVGQEIKRESIGRLIFVPRSERIGEAEFSFSLIGAGCGARVVCRVRLTDEKNEAPTLVESVGTGRVTQSGVGYYGRLEASDPDGDALEFIVVGYPRHGSVSIIDSGAGKFRYTPSESYVGQDEFKVVVRDEYGNYTEPCSVRIRVTERMSDTLFADMTERSEHCAAIALCAAGVMDGRKNGTLDYFMPDEIMSRAEFVAVALRAFGIDGRVGEASFFEDDGEIPSVLRPYVAEAARRGVVDGDFTDGGLIFRPNDPITLESAAVILDKLLGTSGDGEEELFLDSSGVKPWARGAVYAMVTLGIIDRDPSGIDGGTSLCRATVAEYVFRAMNVN